jgi:hypothetical protein
MEVSDNSEKESEWINKLSKSLASQWKLVATQGKELEWITKLGKSLKSIAGHWKSVVTQRKKSE